MIDLNYPPRLWKSSDLTVDLEHVLAVLKVDYGDKSDCYVYIGIHTFTVGPKTGESLLKALEDYRSVKVTELR